MGLGDISSTLILNHNLNLNHESKMCVIEIKIVIEIYW